MQSKPLQWHSCSSGTRMEKHRLIAQKSAPLARAEYAAVARPPAICAPSSWNPPPYARPPSVAKTPVRSVPMKPLTPWHTNASNLSSTQRISSWNAGYAKQHPTAPITIAPMGVTNPAAGVMMTSPTTKPVTAPTADTYRCCTRTRATHTTKLAAAAKQVFNTASAAVKSAANAEPPLKPNQPNHSKAPPRITKGTLCGCAFSVCARALPGPRSAAKTKAVVPVHSCTTVPPAKSFAPSSSIQPPGPQTQWQTGAYTTRDHKKMKIMYALNRIRSTTAPEMMAAPMIAKAIWKATKSNAGTAVSGQTLSSKPCNPMYAKSPIKGEPVPNAREKPSKHQGMATTPMEMRLIIMVLSTLPLCTRPP
mmetsp:Transcript_67403/g.206425  ORF Transcript_67403/g.206425 Transcript_67403/m.206425 type:complete len:364 (-) Transcript_67403:63-1154(-)